MANLARFQHRTASLTKILNSDLRPLNMSVLYGIGYLDHISNVIGYAFRLPPNALPYQKPLTIHQLLTRVKSGKNFPNLGERFELAKALPSRFTVSGGCTRTLGPKNILFWPKPGTGVTGEPNMSKPYLMGFDIARPDGPEELSEKPPIRPEDDIYRHPNCRGEKARSFQPLLDIYSLGIILYEIGVWRKFNFRISTVMEDPHNIEGTMGGGPVQGLKRYTGIRYRNAVMACLSREFDIWAKFGIISSM